MQAQGQRRVDVKSFAARYRSKSEIHRFLTVDVGAYLCPVDCCTIYWLKDICAGRKKYINCADVQYLSVPQYEGLDCTAILGFVQAYNQLKDYWPSEADMAKLPRQFIINVCYTVVGQPFAQWVRDAIERRNEKIAADRDLFIELDGPIAAAFQRSTAISTQKGNGCFALKVGSKRPRLRDEMNEERGPIRMLEAENRESRKRIQELEDSLKQAKQEASSNEAASQILTKMINDGEAVMDSHGRVQITGSKSKEALGV